MLLVLGAIIKFRSPLAVIKDMKWKNFFLLLFHVPSVCWQLGQILTLEMMKTIRH